MSVERSELNVERSAPKGAVFLSYASQDAEPARRICEALRAAGAEVWFDQSELVGGDQWDQKIRGQIKSCALFVPVISVATNARREGYFRREWKLAVDRTHDMDEALPFLVPVVVDGTTDAGAFVPEKFREVQWTRLPGGETPAKFSQRVKKLLSGDAPQLETERPRSVERGEGAAPPARQRSAWPRLALGALAFLVLGGSLFFALRPHRRPAERAKLLANATPVAAPLSDARRLADQARALLLKPGGAGTKFDTATLLCDRALNLDPAEAEVWAVASQVDSRTWYHNFDRSERRAENARSKAAKALNLAPNSFEARLAQATYLVLVAGLPMAEQAAPTLRTLHAENSREFRVLSVLSNLLQAEGRDDESLACLQAGALLPGVGATAHMEAGWTLHRMRRIAEMEAALDRSIAIQPLSGAVSLRVYYDLGWHGDLDHALATLRKLPAEELAEDNGIAAAVRVYRWRHEPADLLKFLATVPRDWITWGIRAPKAALTGDAYAELGRPGAARADWQGALALVEQRLAVTPNDRNLHEWRAYLLSALGETERAREAYARSLETPPLELALLNIEKIQRLVSPDEVIDELERRVRATTTALDRHAQIVDSFISAADLRLNPAWDSMRSQPRFQALQARLDADPRFSPTPKKTSDAPVPDQKSVAVLAFANLSDDKANEYFSDGISEELLNVLAKIPGLKVSARTSAFYFKGKEVPIPEIAKQLGVAYVIEGSVRKQGDKVRITAQLIKAADGFHVWSDTFTRDLKDIFAVQDEIAGLISENLQLKLAVTARRAVVSPAAYSLLLQGRFFAQRESNEGRIQSVAYYRQAIAREPAYALAWGEMARDFAMLGRYGGLPIREAMQEARAAAQRALELNPDEPYGLNALGWVQRLADWDWRGARKSFERAVALAPDNPTTLGDAAVLLFNIGLTDEAIALARRGVERDPLSARAHFSLGDILSNADRVAESVEAYSRGIDLAPNTEAYRAIRGMALSRLRRSADAVTSLKQEPNEFYQLVAQALVARDQGDQVASVKARDELIAKTGNSMAGWVAVIFAHQGESDRAFAWMERAAQERDRMVPWTKGQYYLRSLHTDPRWPEFLRKLGLTDEQLK